MSLQQQLYDKICEIIDLSGSQRFLLCSSAIDWDWPVAQDGYIERKEYSFVGYMPQPVEADKLYFARSDKELFQAYSTVINSVNPTKPDQYHHKLGELDNQIAAAKAKLDNDTVLMNQAMKDAKELPEFNLKDWMVSSGWGGMLEANRKALQTLNEDKIEFIDSWDDPRKDAVEALDQRESERPGPGYVWMMNGGRTEIYPNFYVEKNGQEWARKVRSGGVPTEIELSTCIQQSQPQEKRNAVQKGVDLGKAVFKLMNPLAGKQDAEHAKVSIKFKAITTVSVRPDPSWYKTGYLSKIGRENHWKEPTTETLLGSNGILHAVIVGFVAVYEPSFAIHSSEKKLKQAGELNISLPPLINGSIPVCGSTSEGGCKKACITKDSATIESSGQSPQIIGVIIEKVSS